MARIAARIQRRKALRLLSPPMSVELAYVAALRRGMRWLVEEVTRWLQPRLVEVARADAAPVDDLLELVQELIRAFTAKTIPAFDELSARVVRANERGLRALGIDLRKVPGLEAILRHLRDANVQLLENAGRRYAADVARVLSAPEAVSLRVEELGKQIAERGNVALSHAEFIARDQTLKLNGQVNAFRQQTAGITAYVWSTSLDERVRPEHREREGKSFSWAAPPEGGHPGEDFQCRCVPIPVVPALDD